MSPTSTPSPHTHTHTHKVLARGVKAINPIGFKIGLEVMARCKANPVKDVGITFQQRVAGESKLSMKENVLYVKQLMALYLDRYALPLAVIALVLLFTLVYLIKQFLL